MIDLLIFYNQQSKLCQVLGNSEDSSNEQREHHWAQTSPDNSSEVEHLHGSTDDGKVIRITNQTPITVVCIITLHTVAL